MKNLTVTNIVNGYKDRLFSPVEVTAYYLNRIEEEKELNAYITVLKNESMSQAKIAEQKIMTGLPLGKLEGVPISYKDNLYTKGIQTTSGSKIHQDFIPSYNAAVVNTLQKEGAINLGKVNMHEYAFGITSNNPFYGPVKNPWNREYSPGGSSGGSGAAVAIDLCAASIGTDTGGSIRIPAAACGIVGLKPTYGYVNMDGIKNLAWSLDHVGPLTKDVSDMAIMMNALTGDNYLDTLVQDIRGVRIGVPKNYFTEYMDAELLSIYQKALEQLESLGAILIDIAIPFTESDANDILAVAVSEAGYVHRDHVNKRLNDFGADVKQILSTSNHIKALDYIHALKRAEEIKQNFSQLFSNIDVLTTPTISAMTQKIGVEEVEIDGKTEDVFSTLIRYPQVFNVTGQPALSVPCGINKAGMPVGLQFSGAHHSERKLIQVAYAYEQHFLKEFYKSRNEKMS